MSNTYDDPAKKLSRVKIGEFIDKHVLTRKRPEHVVVTCFPGAEVEGQEALEVKEIYLPMGILPKNIIGLERKREVAKRIQAANLGINVVRSRSLDYFLSPDAKPSDVIILDYMGQQTQEEASALETLVAKQLIKPGGVLGTVFFGSRESKEMKNLLAIRSSRVVDVREKERILNSAYSESKQDEATYDLKFANLLANNLGLEKLRDGITIEIFTLLLAGTLNQPVGRHLYSNHPARNILIANIKEEFEREKERMLSTIKETLGLSRDAAIEELENDMQGTYENVFLRHRHEMIFDFLGKNSKMTKTQIEALVGSLERSAQRSYIVRELERYKYISNSGSPMLIDLFAVENFPQQLGWRAAEIINYKMGKGELSTLDDTLEINPNNMSEEKFNKALDRIVVEYNKSNVMFMKKRVDLTPDRIESEETYDAVADSQPVQTVEEKRNPSEEQKKEIYALLRGGQTSDEKIMQEYGVSRRRLGCYKAWTAMRNKETNPLSEKLAV